MFGRYLLCNYFLLYLKIYVYVQTIYIFRFTLIKSIKNNRIKINKPKVSLYNNFYY